MIKDKREVLLKKAHERMVKWWNKNVDINGDVQAASDFYTFLDNLLVYPEHLYWDRWIGDKIPTREKIDFKRFILTLIIKRYTKI